MRVLHVLTSLRGGAGIAAARSVQALRDSGVDARYVYLHGRGVGDPLGSLAHGLLTRPRQRMYTSLNRFTQRKESLLSTPFGATVPRLAADRIEEFGADVVHFHSFTNVSTVENIFKVASVLPTVVTLHDERFYTMGCHHADGCQGYAQSCSHCPQIRSVAAGFQKRTLERTLVAVHGRKRQLAVVAPSWWILARAEGSRVLGGGVARLHHVPNCVPTEVFSPERRVMARSKFGISQKQWVLLSTGAKGQELLQETVASLERRLRVKTAKNVLLAHLGIGAPKTGLPQLVLPGTDALEATALFWAAGDTYLNTTRLDNFPNTNLEALASGVPVIVSDVGGAAEAVESTGGGLIVSRTSPAFAGAAQSLLDRAGERQFLATRAREGVLARYASDHHGRSLLDVYREVSRDVPAVVV